MIQIRKSVNIKYDSKNQNLINEYFATSSHSEVIKQVLSGILGGNTRAHIAFGPYGAGKSFISTILTGLASSNYKEKDVEALVVKFEDVDVEVGKLIKDVSKNNMDYIPIFINGYDGKFDESLIRNLKNQLSEYGIMDDDFAYTIDQIILNWKDNYASVYSEFLIYLDSIRLTYEDFLRKIETNEVLFSFSKFYEKITAGAQLPVTYTNDVVTTFEKTAIKLMDQNKGLFLVYDEFGRMLQNIKPEDLNQFMQQLQDLAELANNSCKNLSLLFVVHKPISHYFSYLEKDRRSEFSKIEKRFSITSIQSDHATFVNIASQYISNLKTIKIDERTFKSTSRTLSKYKLFSTSFNQTEIDNLIIKRNYPIHPVTMFLLPLISKVFGQNERTLFSFLSDSSQFGFLGFINSNSNGFYYPEQLADYFFLSVDDDTEVKEVSILKKNLGLIKTSVVDSNTISAERIYKFIAIWGSTNANNYVPLNDEFISFSLSISKKDCGMVLDELASLKLIRYNREKKHWHLIESDSIDIDKEVLSRKSFLSNNPQLVIRALNDNNPYKYIYPTQHNSAYEVTRFALVKILVNGYPVDFDETDNHDFLINLMINYNDESVTNNDIIIDLKFNDKYLTEIMNRLAVVELLISDKIFLHTYKNALIDLEFEKARILSELEELYRSIFSSKIRSKNLEIHINGSEELSNFLSDYANKIFSETITIKNDQINMFVLTTQQKNATLKVIESIIDRESFDLDDIYNKSKPEDLIYYSIKSSIDSNQFNKLKAQITKFLDDNESGSFTSLTDIAISPPFGIRPTLSSTLVLISIIDRYKNILFSRDGNYIATMDAKQIFDAGLGKNSFDYTYSDFDFKHQKWMDTILTIFPNPSEGVAKKSQSIQVLSSVLNWFNQLPVIIQQGESIGMQERYFLRSIEKSKTNPFQSLHELVEYDFRLIEEIKINIDSAYDRFLDIMNENLRKEFQVDNWKTWALSKEQIKRKSNNLVKIASKTESILRDYALIIDTIEIERWTKGSYEKMISMIKSDFLDASNLLDTVSIQFNGVTREVQNIKIGSKAQNLKRNLISLIDANSRYVSSSEIEKLLIELVEKYVK